jgi:hypothetical protein
MMATIAVSAAFAGLAALAASLHHAHRAGAMRPESRGEAMARAQALIWAATAFLAVGIGGGATSLHLAGLP